LSGVEYIDPSSQSNYQNAEMQMFESALTILICKFIETKDRSWLTKMVTPIVLMSTTHKSIGFSEEQEVRIVAVPIPENPPKSTAAAKVMETHFHERNGLIIPHFNLFENQQMPITRVIVGPHTDSARRVKSVRMLLESCGYNVPVTQSEIPYIGK
jgi:hypothetical protein